MEVKPTKVAGFLTGIGPFVNSAKNGVTSLWTSSRSVGLLKAGERVMTILTEKGPDVDLNASARVRFEQACEHFGLDEAGIKVRQTQTSQAAITYFVMTSIVAGLAIASVRFNATSDLYAWTWVVWLSLTPALFVMALKNAFANWQLRTRALGTFNDYWSSSDRLPKS